MKVSYDLIEKFAALEVPNYYKENDGKYYLDLWQLNKELLKKCGILEDNIKIIDFCTVRDKINSSHIDWIMLLQNVLEQ